MTNEELVEFVRTDYTKTTWEGDRCWADNGSYSGCSLKAQTDIGLCLEHFEEVIP